MKKYLFDSDSVSYFYDKFSSGYANISAKLSGLKETDKVYISILTLYELEYGYANAPDEKKNVVRKKIEESQQDFEILPLSRDGSKLFGDLKKSIKNSRNISSPNIKKHNIDLILAATAIVEDCILVSADSIYVDIQKINSELQLENWLIDSREK